jgi:hypothetical protein
MVSTDVLEEHSAYHLLSCWFLAQLIFSTLKMEAICSSETSVDTRTDYTALYPTRWYSSIQLMLLIS